MEPKKYNIGSGMWFFLGFSAVFVDLIQILAGVVVPGISWVISLIFNIFYGGSLAIYFHFKGVSMVKGKSAKRFIMMFGVDELTLGFFPAWTVAIFLTHRAVKAAESPELASSKIFVKAQQGVSRLNKVGGIPPRPAPKFNTAGTREPSRRPPPLNQGNIRLPRPKEEPKKLNFPNPDDEISMAA
jgi:hypothetical protein